MKAPQRGTTVLVSGRQGCEGKQPPRLGSGLPEQRLRGPNPSAFSPDLALPEGVLSLQHWVDLNA
jgi:hypothetical protein